MSASLVVAAAAAAAVAGAAGNSVGRSRVAARSPVHSLDCTAHSPAANTEGIHRKTAVGWSTVDTDVVAGLDRIADTAGRAGMVVQRVERILLVV